jgi:hypothetical protein
LLDPDAFRKSFAARRDQTSQLTMSFLDQATQDADPAYNDLDDTHAIVADADAESSESDGD